MGSVWVLFIWLLTGLAAVIQGVMPFLPGGQDMDLLRNGAALRRARIEVIHHEITAGGIVFPLTVLVRPGGGGGPVYVVLHDDEDDAFDAALAALVVHGGRLIALESHERRRIHGRDPNRIFGTPDFEAFTAFFADLAASGRPLIALHNNRDGYGGRQGGISVRLWQAHPGRFVAFAQGGDEDDFVLTSGVGPVPEEGPFVRFRDAMAARRINVVYEHVTGEGDHSMAVWAAHEGLAYYNVEAEHGHRRQQAEMLDALLDYLTPQPVS